MESLRAIVEALEESPTAHTVAELTEAAEAAGVDLGEGLKEEKVGEARKALDAQMVWDEPSPPEGPSPDAAARTLAGLRVDSVFRKELMDRIGRLEEQVGRLEFEKASPDARDIDPESDAVPPSERLEAIEGDAPILSTILELLGIYGHAGDSTPTRTELRDGIRGLWMTYAPVLRDILEGDTAAAATVAPAGPAPTVAAIPTGIPILSPKPEGAEVIELPPPSRGTGVFPIHDEQRQAPDVPVGVFASDIPVLTPESRPQPVARPVGSRHVNPETLPILKPEGA